MAHRAVKPKTHIKAGDIVIAIAGEDAGSKKTGKVLRVFPHQQRAIVEGFNQVKKTLRKSQDNPQGGIIEKEAAIAISNLKLAQAGDAKPTGKSAKKPAAKSRRSGKKTEDSE